MDPQTLLQQLAPLREPEAISWWPLAPGWWLVGLALIVLIAVASAWLWHRYKANHYRRLAQKQLTKLSTEGALTVANLNRLLKATALQIWSPDAVAKLHGANWQAFLTTSAPKIPSNSFDELSQIYQQPEAPASDALIKAASRWIDQHRMDPDAMHRMEGIPHD